MGRPTTLRTGYAPQKVGHRTSHGTHRKSEDMDTAARLYGSDARHTSRSADQTVQGARVDSALQCPRLARTSIAAKPPSNPASKKDTVTHTYERLTPRMALQLAAPHTWPAAIMPSLMAICAAAATTPPTSVLMACVLLAICVLMQAAVNTFNDYYDFIKGADTADDNVEESDATLVYHRLNPTSALAVAVGFLVAAFALGIYVIWQAGLIPLVIGVAGALVVVLYSAGKTPISYLPIGELTSGVVMGGLIPLACYQALSGSFDLRALVWAVPTMIGVALIMLTNNTCDLEKDIPAGRKTLPVVVGRDHARCLYHALVYLWIAAIIVLVAAFFTGGLIIMPFMVLAAYPLAKALLANPLTPPTRIGAMGQICSLNVALGAFYAAAILASDGITLVL